MAEYILSYTAKEIDERLGLVGQNVENINKVNESIEKVNTDVNKINEDIQTVQEDVSTINEGIVGINENIEGINTALEGKADKNHTHDYADTNHTHDNYAEVGHAHDYAELNHEHDNYAAKDHNHNDKYDEFGAADEALSEAIGYTDNAVKAVKDDLLNGAGSAYDTLKELGDLIDDNTDAIDAFELVASSKADKDHTHPGQEEFADSEPSGQAVGDYWMQSY